MPVKVLLFTATRAYRHESIPTAIQELQRRASSIDVRFDATEDLSVFTSDTLKYYGAVGFVLTSGEVLGENEKSALEQYFAKGGNFIGVHSAASTLPDAPFYVDCLGSIFDYHPACSRAVVHVLDHSHPGTSMLPEVWNVEDEMYNFRSDPRIGGSLVLLAADEPSYTDDGVRKYDHGSPHPLAWYRERNPGRSFYTALGHRSEAWQDELFISHILGGLKWALSG